MSRSVRHLKGYCGLYNGTIQYDLLPFNITIQYSIIHYHLIDFNYKYVKFKENG